MTAHDPHESATAETAPAETDTTVIARYAELGRRETEAEAYAGRAGGPPRGMTLALFVQAQLARENAAFDAARAPAALPAASTSRGPGRRKGSTAFSVRLEDEIYAALVERGERQGVAPSALARSYIRAGVAGDRRGEWLVALERLDEAAASLRALVR